MFKLRAGFTPVAIGIAAAVMLAGPAQAALRSQLAAGYQANHHTSHQPFRYIAASWTVPPLSCPGPIASGGSDGDSYFFVALASGRFGSGQGSVPGAEEVGVRELCAGILSAYTAYAVMNGAYEIQNVTPSPGDVIFASVYYRAGKYRFALRDDVAGHSGSLAANRHWKVSRYDEYDASRLVGSTSALSRRGTRFTDRWRHF